MLIASRLSTGETLASIKMSRTLPWPHGRSDSMAMMDAPPREIADVSFEDCVSSGYVLISNQSTK